MHPTWQPEDGDIPITFEVAGQTLAEVSVAARARADHHLEGAPGWTEVHLNSTVREQTGRFLHQPDPDADPVQVSGDFPMGLVATVTLWLRPDERHPAWRGQPEVTG